MRLNLPFRGNPWYGKTLILAAFAVVALVGCGPSSSGSDSSDAGGTGTSGGTGTASGSGSSGGLGGLPGNSSSGGSGGQPPDQRIDAVVQKRDQAFKQLVETACQCESQSSGRSVQDCINARYGTSAPESCERSVYKCDLASYEAMANCMTRSFQKMTDCMRGCSTSVNACRQKYNPDVKSCRAKISNQIRAGLQKCSRNQQPNCGSSTGSAGNASGGTTTGSGSSGSGTNLSQCRQTFLNQAGGSKVWYRRLGVHKGEWEYDFCQRGEKCVELFLRFNSDGTYWFNYRLYTSWGSSPNWGGFCRNPGTRSGQINWKMGNCDTVLLSTGCGKTDKVQLQGGKLVIDSMHGGFALEPVTPEKARSGKVHDPLRLDGCYSDDRDAEPNCK